MFSWQICDTVRIYVLYIEIKNDKIIAKTNETRFSNSSTSNFQIEFSGAQCLVAKINIEYLAYVSKSEKAPIS